MTEEIVQTAETVAETAPDRCVFLGANDTCEKLNQKVCPVGGCSFQVLPGEEEQKRESWAKRLSALDEARQKEIAKKYYGGGRPWRVNK
ncbi:MAG: hypothetical protein IJW44_04590 [Clostridia bacterium]|nr:hypothetical protein [Clostridia bacterium]